MVTMVKTVTVKMVAETIRKISLRRFIIMYLATSFIFKHPVSLSAIAVRLKPPSREKIQRCKNYDVIYYIEKFYIY